MKPLLLVLVLGVTSLFGQTAPINEAAKVPVRRVVLYKNGVGYFEHTGKVHDNQELTIDFTSAQLNDALKSLTLLDEGEGHITGVRYNSATPLDEQLRTLHVALGQSVSYSELLDSLRGARVEVRDKGVVIRGRVLSVEDRNISQGEGKPPLQQNWVSLVSDTGEVHSFVVSPSLGVRPLEGEMREDLSRYLQMLAAARAQDLRRMTVSTQGRGEREIFVSYISEVPVWKTNYRILLADDAKKPALLQGWAIVDNTVGEDWKNVELSLASGAPQSFVQNLSQPYYLRRPEIALPETAMLTPQTHEETVTTTNGAPVAAAGGVIGGIVQYDSPRAAAAIPDSMSKVQQQTVGKGAGAGVGSGMGRGVGGNAGSTTNLYDAATINLGHLDSATGNDLGGLFEYKLKQPVSIAKNQSALVPIVNARVEAEHVTLWNPGQPQPLRAIWLTNTSGETLDGGNFSIIDANAFAGEGVLEAIHPKEKRLLSYAVDDAVRVVRDGERQSKPLRHIRIAKGVMWETTEERESTLYTVRNADTRERNIILEHPRETDWKLVSSTQPEETTASLQRFRLKIAPQSQGSLKVEMLHPLLTRVSLSDVNQERLALLIQHSGSNAELTPQLKRLLDQRSELSGLEVQMNNVRARMSEIQQDQQRLRENMKALKGSAEERALLQRYTGELNAQEDELASFKKQLSEIDSKRAVTHKALADTIASTTFDGDL